MAIVDGTQLFFWNCKSQEAVKVDVESGGANDLAYSPNGRLIALGCENGTVVLRNREREQEVGRYDWKIGRVTTVAFAPDGLTGAVGGEGGQVVVWDVDA